MIFTDLNEKGINFYSWPPLKPLTGGLGKDAGACVLTGPGEEIRCEPLRRMSHWLWPFQTFL